MECLDSGWILVFIHNLVVFMIECELLSKVSKNIALSRGGCQLQWIVFSNACLVSQWIPEIHKVCFEEFVSIYFLHFLRGSVHFGDF